MDFLFRFVRNDVGMIRSAFADGTEMQGVWQRFTFMVRASYWAIRSFGKARNADDIDLLHLYYKCYYYVMKNTYSNAISVLEGQVALLRNTLPIFLLWGIIMVCKGNCCIGLIMIFFAFLLLFAMFYRQFKIYELVRDDCKYLSRLKY